MTIFIKGAQSGWDMDHNHVEDAAARILNALDCPEGELSILLVDDETIAEINQKYRNRTGPTNVIAFSMREGEFSGINPDLLGDVVISLETVEKEAKAAGINFENRFFELLVHGVLHLFGYDHKASDAMHEKMERKTDEVLKKINL